MYYCITFILSNPCFVLLYLKLAAKLVTAAGPKAYSWKESDDGTADVAEVIASTSTTTCFTPRPMSCPPDVPIPPPPPKKSSSFPPAAGLRERNYDSRKLQERIEALLEEQDTSRNSRVQFGLYLTSMIPLIHDLLLVDVLDEAHRLLLQYVCLSHIMMLQETQQHQHQQQQQQHQHQQPYLHPPHPPHQQPAVSHDI